MDLSNLPDDIRQDIENLLPHLSEEDLARLEAGLAEFARDWLTPAEFRNSLIIKADGPKKLKDVIEPWQLADFSALDPGLLYVAGLSDEPGCIRAYFERARGHSKTTDIAVIACWVLSQAKQQLRGVVAAGDRDQAGLLRNAVEVLLRLNPWLAAILEVQNYRIINRASGSELEIISSDAASAFGETPDITIIDELTHWPDGKGEKLWDAIFSAVAKRPRSLLLIISNAGEGEGISWQWQKREMARLDSAWYFSRQDGPVASWITPEVLAEQRKGLTPQSYNRLWLNQWTSGVGDALDPEDIEACITQPGPISQAQDGWWYMGALDLGIKHDHCGFVVLGVNERRIRLAQVLQWIPDPVVDIAEVEAAILEVHKRFDLAGVCFDPHQAIYLAQRLTKAGVRMIEQQFSPKECTGMAMCLMRALENRLIDLYDDSRLRQDLAKVSIVENQWGYKLVAPKSKAGHADTAIALAIGVKPTLELIAPHLVIQNEQAVA